MNLLSVSHSRQNEESRTVLVAVMSRMILTPLVLLPVLTGLLMSHASGVSPLACFAISLTLITGHARLIFGLTNVFLIASSPAFTLAQITQTACGKTFERLVTRIIF